LNKWEAANEWVGGHLFYIVLVLVLLGFFFPLPKLTYLKDIVVMVFAYTTFVTALGTGIKNFLTILKKPAIPIWIFILMHLFLTMLAWVFGRLFFMDEPMMRLGLLIYASIPTGVTSILWSSLAGGNVALSIMVVTIDTLLAPVILPLLFLLFIGTEIAIDYVDLIKQLIVMVAIPSIAGMIIGEMTGDKIQSFTKGVGGLTAKLSLPIVAFINSSLMAPDIVWSFTLASIFFVAFLMVLLGFVGGYLGSFTIKEHSVEIIMSSVFAGGIRNISVGLVLAISYFPATVGIPMMLTIFFQQPLAAVVSFLYRRYFSKTEPTKDITT
jgi:predicted Na+-dependent transporter